MKGAKTDLFDRDKLLSVFDYLNARLAENQMQLEITIYRGVVMTVVYDNRPATRDIDCVFGSANSELLNHILDLTRFTFNLSENWINEDVKEPLQELLREDLETFKTYSNLKILRPVPEQLLAMKILAARAEPSKDFVDAIILCKELEIQTRGELLRVISQYVPLTLLGERQRVFIIYLGEDLGYDWK